MKNQNLQRNQGFIALISAIIIAAILLGFTATFGANSFHSRFDTLNSEFKRVSLGLAESCINSALLKVAQDYNYDYHGDHLYNASKGGVVIVVDSTSNPPTECIINSVTMGTEDIVTHQKLITITSSGEYNNANSSISNSAIATNPNVTIARANLFVVTQFINNNGGSLTPSSSSMTINASSHPSPAGTFSGSDLGVLTTIDANTPYSVSGTSVAGYGAPVADPLCSGTGLSSGATVTCVISYDDMPTTGTISVVANVTNNDGGIKTATSFNLYIDNVLRVPGQAYTFSPGTHTVKADADLNYSISGWGYDCSGVYNAGSLSSSLQAGQNKTCTINYDDNPPPSPQCSDTVMMLDRTASMTSTDLAGEKNAAIGLLNLYSPLNPAPKTAVGVFGGTSITEPYLASIVQSMTTNYTNLINSVNSNLVASSTYTNLQSAIDKGQSELATLASDGKQKVLILLSDGGANRPCPTGTPNCGANTNTTATSAATISANNAKAAGTKIYTIHYGSTGTNYSDQSYLATLANNSANDHIGTFTTPTGLLSPTSNIADGATSWLTPTNAYAIGGGSATDTGGNKQRFYNFNFPAFSTGTTINGIEIKANASVTDSPINGSSSNIFPSSTGTFTQWIPMGSANDYSATSDNSDTTYIDTTPLTMTHTFKVPVISLPTGANIDSVNLNIRAKSTTTGSPMQFVEEKDATHVLLGATQNLTTTYTKYTYAFTTKPDGTKWLPADLNPWLISFGVRSNAGKPVQVSQIYITITYH